MQTPPFVAPDGVRPRRGSRVARRPSQPPCLWSCGIPVSPIGFERKCGAGRVHEVGAPPRFVADQPPTMSRARVVLRQQDITGTYGKALATARLEFQRTAERDDKARHRILVPLVGAAGLGLLERQIDTVEHIALEIASLAPGKIDCSFLKMRVAIVAGPQSHTSDHGFFLPVRRCVKENIAPKQGSCLSCVVGCRELSASHSMLPGSAMARLSPRR